MNYTFIENERVGGSYALGNGEAEAKADSNVDYIDFG